MHIEIALRLVEGDGRQPTCFDIDEEQVGSRGLTKPGITQVPITIGQSGSEAREIVERLMMRLEIWALGEILALAMTFERRGPTPSIPCPIDSARREPVADHRVVLRG